MPEEQTDTDEIVAKKVQGGDTEAFNELVRRYESKLLRYGKRFIATNEDIEDNVQDIFIRAYQNIQSFDVAQKFSPWIYRIAHNVFVNEIRSRSRKPYTTFAFDEFIPHFSYTNEQQSNAEREEVTALLEKNIVALSYQNLFH